MASAFPAFNGFRKCFRSVFAERMPMAVAICSCVNPTAAIDLTIFRFSTVGLKLEPHRPFFQEPSTSSVEGVLRQPLSLAELLDRNPAAPRFVSFHLLMKLSWHELHSKL